MSEFAKRALTGAALAAVILGAIWAGRTAWRVLLFVVSVGCFYEYLTLVPKRIWPMMRGVIVIVFCVEVLRHFPREWALATVLVVWANDVFAYIIGMALGRHKMASRVSPKKSWEGFAGGVVGAMVVAVAVGRWLGLRLGGGEVTWSTDWRVWAGFGLVVAFGAVGGDLLESAVKRRAGVKNSGRVFPGHGGFLDRFDALLGAAPVAYVFLKIFLR